MNTGTDMTRETPLPDLGSIEAAAARLAGAAVETPLLESGDLNARTGGRVFIKPEMLQRTGSFKFRGAFNKISQIPAGHKGGVVAFSDDVERLYAARKPGLAFTLGAMGSRDHNFYNEAYQRQGYADLALEVQRLWLDRRRDEAVALIPDSVAEQLNLLGTDDMVRDRIRRYRHAGVTTIRVDPEGEGLRGRLETLGRFMRLLDGVNAEAPARAPNA